MANNQGFKQTPAPCSLQGWGVRLEPLTHLHTEGLAAAARDGELWNLRVTSVPEPEQTTAYIQAALDGLAAGHMLPVTMTSSLSSRALKSVSLGTLKVSNAHTSILPVSCCS